MKRTTAAFLMLGGTSIIGSQAYDFNQTYSRESVFQRQSRLIEHVIPAESAGRRESLRTDLARLDTPEERCIYERRSIGLLNKTNHAQVELPDEFGPNYRCSLESVARQNATEWYNIGSALAIVAGIAGFIGSFMKKKDLSLHP
jgi:hypothetical protein